MNLMEWQIRLSFKFIFVEFSFFLLRRSRVRLREENLSVAFQIAKATWMEHACGALICTDALDDMAERILPKPDAFAVAPPADVSILEHYSGTFEAVYVLLHPFIDAAEVGTEQFKPGTYPDRQFIAKYCRVVPWAEIIEWTGLPSIAAVDVGLRTSILGLKPEFSNRDYAAKIESLVELSNILPPTEGGFSDLLHDRVLASIQSLGYEWVWVGDEFCTERKRYWIDELKNQESGPTVGHCNVFTPDKALLWTTHWDSHFSFLCSSERNLNAIQEAYHFEGFFCDSTTEVYWSVRH